MGLRVHLDRYRVPVERQVPVVFPETEDRMIPPDLFPQDDDLLMVRHLIPRLVRDSKRLGTRRPSSQSDSRGCYDG
jgi:hypothetical protein